MLRYGLVVKKPPPEVEKDQMFIEIFLKQFLKNYTNKERLVSQITLNLKPIIYQIRYWA